MSKISSAQLFAIFICFDRLYDLDLQKAPNCQRYACQTALDFYPDSFYEEIRLVR